MQRQGEEYWRKAIRGQKTSGMSAAGYCRKHKLQRGTFLRWRQRLSESEGERGLVEIDERTVIRNCEVGDRLEIRVGSDIKIVVPQGLDIGLVGGLIAAIRDAR
jgi:hypothetical protein